MMIQEFKAAESKTNSWRAMPTRMVLMARGGEWPGGNPP